MADFGDDRTILVPGEELLVLCTCPPDEPEPHSHELDRRVNQAGIYAAKKTSYPARFATAPGVQPHTRRARARFFL